jgi:hypothetical protein
MNDVLDIVAPSVSLEPRRDGPETSRAPTRLGTGALVPSWRDAIQLAEARLGKPDVATATSETECVHTISLAGATPVAWCVGPRDGVLAAQVRWRARFVAGDTFGYVREWPETLELGLAPDGDASTAETSVRGNDLVVVVKRQGASSFPAERSEASGICSPTDV